MRRYARAPNIRFEIFSLLLLLPLLSLLIITIAEYGAAIRNRQLAHSAADATALIAYPISPGHVLFSREPHQRDTLPLIIRAAGPRGAAGTRAPKCAPFTFPP